MLVIYFRKYNFVGITMKNLKNLSSGQLFRLDQINLNKFLLQEQYGFDPAEDRYVLIEGRKILIDGLFDVNRILGYVELQDGTFMVAGQITSHCTQLKFIKVEGNQIHYKNKTLSGTAASIYQHIKEHADLKPILDSLFGSRYAAYV